MEFTIKFNTVIESGWSIVYTFIEGSQVIISISKDQFCLPVSKNTADFDEMLHDAAFLLGLHGLPKYTFRGFWSTKGSKRLCLSERIKIQGFKVILQYFSRQM